MNKLAGLGLAGILLVSSAGEISCTSAFISNETKTIAYEQVREKPYVALFEGLQPFSGDRMKEVGEHLEEIGVVCCTTSGNPNAHMEMIRRAYNSNQPVIIGGFSMGEIAARNLAETCEKEGIDVDLLMLIDGPNLGKIHGNVRKVMDIRGFEPIYLARRSGRYSEKDLENKSTIIEHYDIRGNHLDIPEYSRSIIESGILEVIRK